MTAATTRRLADVLRRHRLLEPAEQALVDGELAAAFAEPAALLRELVRRGGLTVFQARHVARGRARDLILAGYVLLDRLGEGGMGQVFLARHQRLGRRVAVKLIRGERGAAAGAAALRRFQREIRAAAQLDHPNVVRALDAGCDGDTFFLVMEHVAGTDLARLVGERGPLPVPLALACVRQAALALRHAHAQGLVHRDVKPSNLMLVDGSAPPVVKLLDLGLARWRETQSAGARLTGQNLILGTPDYLAPEQARDAGAADIRADLYSLGCTFYHLLAGRPPFPDGPPLERLLKHATLVPPPVEQLRPGTPPAVGHVVRTLMAKDPAHRYQTPGELLAALEAVAGDLTQADLPAAAPPPAPPCLWDAEDPDTGPPLLPERRPRPAVSGGLLWGSVAATGLVLALGLTWFLGRRGPAEAEEAAASRPLPSSVGGEVAVQANRGWQDLHREVVAGQTVTVRAHGGWQLSPRGPGCDALGWITGPRERAVEPEANAGCLLLRVGDLDPPLPVRSLPQRLTAPRGGRLFARINHLDNAAGGGALAVTVEGARPAAADAPAPPPTRVEAAEAALAGLHDPAQVGRFLRSFAGTPQAGRAVALRGPWLRRQPSPLDALTAAGPEALRPAGAPPELVGVVGRPGGQEPVQAVAFSPDGQTLAAAPLDQAVGLWELPSLRERAVLRNHTGMIWRLAFAPDGRYLASGAFDGAGGQFDRSVWLWDPAKAAAVRQFGAHHARWVVSATFTPEGDRLVCGSYGGIKVWHPDTGAELATLSAEGVHWVVALAVSPDGRWLASGCGDHDKTVRLWDLATAQQVRQFHGHEWTVPVVTWSPCGRWIASGGNDHTVRLWDVPGGAEWCCLRGHEGEVRGLAFTPDGAALISAAADGRVIAWDVATGKPRHQWRFGGACHGLAVHPDGRHVAVGGPNGAVYLLRLPATAPGG